MSKSTKTRTRVIAEVVAPTALIEVTSWPEVRKVGKHVLPLKGSMQNTLTAIAAMGLRCSYDTFTQRYNIHGLDLNLNAVSLDDKVTRLFRDECFRQTGYDPGREATADGLQRACEEHQINSVQDYLNGCHWDGVPRLDKWLTTYIGADDTPLHAAWGRLIIVAACRRAFQPGAKFDHVLVIEGWEDQGKSSVVRILAGAKDLSDSPAMFSDSTILDKTEKEQKELLAGIWFYEIAEMASADKADMKKLKAFVVRQEERGRSAYDRFKSEQKRCGVMIGSVNLDPNTGEVIPYLNEGDRRRWWPVRTVLERFKLEELLRDRDQLFAEAMSVARTFVAENPDDPFTLTERWSPLMLPAKLKAAANAKARSREMENPFADLIAPIYADLEKQLESGNVHGAKVVEAGTLLNVPRDAVVVTAEYVRMIVGDKAAHVNGGRTFAAAMAAAGWRRYRTNTMRGYIHDRMNGLDI